MKNKEYQTIIKMIEYINKVKRYTKGLTFEEFSNNDMVVDATVLVISQIGELFKNLDKDFQNQYINIKWHILKGLRNRIVHDYEGINLKNIWYVINHDIIDLKESIKKILNQEEKEE